MLCSCEMHDTAEVEGARQLAGTDGLVIVDSTDGVTPGGDAPGADEQPGEVPALYDLPGVYVRALPPYGEIGALTLEPAQWDGDVGTGRYRAALPYCMPWCMPETGDYQITVESSLVGTGELVLWPGDDPDQARSYRLDAVWRNGLADTTALQLRRRYAGGLLGLSFVMGRQWWTTDGEAQRLSAEIVEVVNAMSAEELVERGELEPEVAAALLAWRAEHGPFHDSDEVIAAAGGVIFADGDGALCQYYRGLQEYFAIRALQCAYSVCYPMSPWYGFWAEYYADRADAVCGDA